MRRIGLLVLLLSLAACGGSSAPPKAAAPSSFTAAGFLKVAANPDFEQRLDQSQTIGTPCTSGAGLSDIARGTQVVIEDQSGKTVALGSLDSGTLSGVPSQSEDTLKCSFAFTLSHVPAGHPFYRVGIGHRGTTQYTAAQMHQPLALTLVAP